MIKKQPAQPHTGIDRLWRGLNLHQSVLWIICTCVWINSPPALLAVVMTNVRFLHCDQHVILHAAPLFPASFRRLKVQILPTLLWPLKVAICVALICGLSEFFLAFTIALLLDIHTVCLQDIANPLSLVGLPTAENMQVLFQGLCSPAPSDEFWMSMSFMSHAPLLQGSGDDWVANCFRHPELLPKYLTGCCAVLQLFVPNAAGTIQQQPVVKPPVDLGRIAVRGLSDWLRLSLRYDRTGLLRRVDGLKRALQILYGIQKAPDTPAFLRRDTVLAVKMIESAFKDSGLKEEQPSQVKIENDRLTSLPLRASN